MWAIVPLKSPDTAKSRLAQVLSPEQRRALFFELARRVLTALQETSGISQVAVVTASEEVARFAQGFDAMILREPCDAGTAQAFAAAIAQLQPRNLDRLLMVAGDLPLIAPRAVEAMIEAGKGHEVVIAPDRCRVGTNALLCAPPHAIAPCFGADSCQRHLAAAQAAKLRSCVVQIDELALDIDLPADLDHLLQHKSAVPTVRSHVPPTRLFADGHA